jgi:hypothetical protein
VQETRYPINLGHEHGMLCYDGVLWYSRACPASIPQFDFSAPLQNQARSHCDTIKT